MNLKAECPCCSGLDYKVCCALYHKGKKAENALLLMRSRYSAYALKFHSYIIQTTYPKSIIYRKDHKIWLQQLKQFTTYTQFLKLEIVNSTLEEQESYVTFLATLKQGSADTSFQETSRFLKDNNQWFYVDGIITPSK